MHSQEVKQKASIGFLGTFHFAGTSDLMSLQPGDIMGQQRQKEIDSVIAYLAQYKPTKIVLEFPFGNYELDSIYGQYLKGKHKLTINERQQLGFKLAAYLGHKHIYMADHPMDLPFGDLQNYLVEIDQADFFPNFLSKMKTEVIDVLQEKYDASTISQFLVFMNQEKYDRLNTGFYLQHLNQIGTDKKPVGVDLNSKWWERNMHIMRNIDKLTEEGDRILILFGQGHTALLKDFYASRTDVVLHNVLQYLDQNP
ncbi:DUF5694 domain-containing protein [Ulvibacterium sp.]|uniref:DUF5694 domain-containing protein n=1 Tax=Ulvibacterium sp. TaxID=2665914 RepID=UPI00262AE87A|nr:DUF5694 domain-containing protein [Ulvibacterium sp.]